MSDEDIERMQDYIKRKILASSSSESDSDQMLDDRVISTSTTRISSSSSTSNAKSLSSSGPTALLEATVGQQSLFQKFIPCKFFLLTNKFPQDLSNYFLIVYNCRCDQLFMSFEKNHPCPWPAVLQILP